MNLPWWRLSDGAVVVLAILAVVASTYGTAQQFTGGGPLIASLFLASAVVNLAVYTSSWWRCAPCGDVVWEADPMSATENQPAQGDSPMSAVGRFLSTFALGLVAGVPVIAGLALESVVAWVVDSGFRWAPFGVAFAWAFGVQVGPVALFGLLGVIAHAAGVARHGWDAAS